MKYSLTTIALVAAATSVTALSARDLAEQEYLTQLQARDLAEQDYYNDLQARELEDQYYYDLTTRDLPSEPYLHSRSPDPRFGLGRAERYAGKVQTAAGGLNQAAHAFAPTRSDSMGSSSGSSSPSYPLGGGSYAGYRRSDPELEFDLDEEILHTREAYAEPEAWAAPEARFGVGKIERAAAKVQTAAAGINQVIGGGAGGAMGAMGAGAMGGGGMAGGDPSGGAGGYAGYRRDVGLENWEEDGLWARWVEEDDVDEGIW